MTELSVDEQRYLLDAFDSSPTDWFRPREVDRDRFSDRTIDRIVQSLARQGLMDGQQDCHARLTDRGRKTATQLATLARRDWRKFYKRRKTRIAVASAAVLFSVLLVILRSNGLL